MNLNKILGINCSQVNKSFSKSFLKLSVVIKRYYLNMGSVFFVFEKLSKMTFSTVLSISRAKVVYAGSMFNVNYIKIKRY